MVVILVAASNSVHIILKSTMAAVKHRRAISGIQNIDALLDKFLDKLLAQTRSSKFNYI